ncbi:hypothetical protein [Methanocella arvoryzae]|uniref:Uncharacterized protein n=1 Tax=Methanocella arvoryzae (strain DSM 22066 / NBRC 105507 / MRE50) TaxID=351160 RepID=Q0W839_METAR|nr:hypothetical protein [Methanocella arvoryzae]CAJ35454.1 hypothetical protein LRC512 [Methanocella arvoryzae MRE50]
MDQSEVTQILMDAELSQGCKCNQIEKEFMILKGSIKKLILDIREQMNAAENPFSNIQMLQMPPPAPVIKEDPIEFEMPDEEEEKKAAEDKAKAEAARQAEKERTMAQEKNAGNYTGCPYAARVSEAHMHNNCPLSASVNSPAQGCPLAKRAETPNRSYETNAHYLELLTYLLQLIEQSRPADRATGNAGLDRYSGGLARSGERHVCSACGRPVSPDYDVHHRGSSWPYSYPHYPHYPPQEHWPDRWGYGMYHEAYGQPYYDPRQFFYEHPEYEPAHYGYPYYGYEAEAGEADPRYRPQNAGRHRDARYPPEYYYRGHGDRRYYWHEPYGFRQEPVRDMYERDYYRPASGPRRVYRGTAGLPEDRYYGPAPDELRGPARYRPVQRRHQEPSPLYRGYDTDEDEFEITEPLPDIDLLPNEPEQEEEPLRIRKRARNVRIVPEPGLPQIVDQPNPRPRRSRAVKHRA